MGAAAVNDSQPPHGSASALWLWAWSVERTCRGEVRSQRGSRRRPRGTLEGARRAVHRGRPARLRPTTPRRCGSCAAALGRRRRSPARWSAHARAATACKWPRSRSVVRTPEPHGEREMGAALTRPTGIVSALARYSCVRRLTISIAIGAAFGHGTRTRTLSRTLTGREASKCAVREMPKASETDS